MKGVFLTWILISLIIILFSIVIIQKETISSERILFTTRQEIKDMERTYYSIDRSLHIVIDLAIRRAIIASTNYILNHSTYLNNTENNLKELIINGTLNGEPIELMENNTLTKWISDLENFYYENLKYNISISLRNLSISLNDSFHIQVSAIASINISKSNVAFLSKEKKLLERTSIEGFEDPFYLMNITHGLLPKKIIKFRYENFTELILLGNGSNGWCYGELTNDLQDIDKSKILVKNDISGNESLANEFCGVIFQTGNGTILTTTHLQSSTNVENLLSNYTKILLSGEKEKAWNISNFIDFVQGGYYINSSYGPSFFDRLEGKNYCSYCSTKVVGLESFINKNVLVGVNLPVNIDSTNIDYLYANQTFGNYIGLDENTVGDEFYAFRIDNKSFSNYFK